VNDALGNYSLTLIDSLSTLAILASSPSNTKYNKALLLFQDGVRDLVHYYGDGSDGPEGLGQRARGFDLDSKVQVFETVIRGLGGLLSAHLFAVGELPIRGYEPTADQAAFAKIWHKSHFNGTAQGITWQNGFEYDGQLLRLAYDLGSRLLPAFWTLTGIPYPRVNLRHGIPFYTNSPLNLDSEDGQYDANQPGSAEITETCSAGAGSLVLEFTVLSRLTGDPRFEELSKRAFWSIWSRRSDLDLIGSGIDAETGNWIGTWTGIGAGIDSFFEYALKSHILLSRDAHPVYDQGEYVEDPRVLFDPLAPEDDSPQTFLDVWDAAHAAIKRHLYRGPNYQHPHYIQADLTTGAARGFWIDALSAYYPGLLTIAGHLEEAMETHLLQTALWTRFSALPERWNLVTGAIEGGLGWWIGRPEFIESTYYLYRATEDPWYFYVGEMVLRDIKRRCWTRCGWASIQNVLTGELSDKMESFFLGETAKYLFLLFDPAHPLNHLDESFVFTTEGHPLLIPRSVDQGRNQGKLYDPPPSSEPTCPVKPFSPPFSISHTAARGDVYHAASLARLHLLPNRDNVESILGDYAADHPSITLSDLSSPSNYTYFPWTLPPELIPYNATSSKMPTRPTFDISFPALPTLGQPTPPLQRVKEGILINFIGGLRIGMVQDMPVLSGEYPADEYRIQSINNLALGRDEKVFLPRDMGSGMLNPRDPNFTRIRDTSVIDLVIEHKMASDVAAKHNSTQRSVNIELPADMEITSDGGMKAAWNSLLSQISNLIKEKPPIPWLHATPPSLDTALNGQGVSRFYIAAATPTGSGAVLIPDWPEVASPAAAPAAPLLWNKIYAADDLCTHKLPTSIARTYQVLIIQRGGCSFSQKLANIPSFPPSPTSLQLVVFVSYEGDDALIRPFLDQPQRTSGGLPKRHPLPVVMVAGGDRAYEALKSAVGMGIKRRYTVQTQGIPIGNLFII